VQGRAIFVGLILVSAAVFMAAASDRASAQVLERILMPGPVSADHAPYEDACASCHEAFSRENQRARCLDCHTEINEDLEAGEGYHGRFTPIATAECASCHTEHEGRDADIVGLDRDTFDHDFTDFTLDGSHASLACVGCHAADQRFRDTDSTCIGCHREDDRHNGNLGESCNDCHTETTWSDAQFDHDSTDFRLTGNHEGADCGGCHRNETYVDTQTDCIACHRIDDVHAGRNGDVCEDCHSPVGWLETQFDHFAETGFATTGGHDGLVCTACHVDTRGSDSPDPACIGCHRADDIHAGNNGTECETCHAPLTWPEVTFDHAVDAGFALNGKHAELACTSCHRGPVETARPDPNCASCHWTVDVHQNALGDACADCHSESGWTESVRFDHDLTVFPLLGLHAAVACESCHADATFSETEDQCVDCHAADDIHEQRLGTDCNLCHNPNDWLIWRFDHNEQTRFPLDGAHEGLDCHACHTRPTTDAVAVSMTCGSCHRSDDVHAGAFGADCELCHSTTAFVEL